MDLDDLPLGTIIPTIHLDWDGVTQLVRGADGRLHSQNGSRGRPEFEVTGPLKLDFSGFDDLLKEAEELHKEHNFGTGNDKKKGNWENRTSAQSPRIMPLDQVPGQERASSRAAQSHARTSGVPVTISSPAASTSRSSRTWSRLSHLPWRTSKQASA